MTVFRDAVITTMQKDNTLNEKLDQARAEAEGIEGLSKGYLE